MNKNNLSISRKINQLAKKDQEIRNILFADGYTPTDEDWEKLKKLDLENCKIIKELVETYGLITISEFGKKASFNTWLIIQHATHDLTFMRKYLRLMKNNIKDINPKNYAYLQDRILLMSKKPQIYGTQVIQDEKSKVFKPNNLKYSVEKTNQLRKEIKLNSLEEYLKDFS